MHGIKSAILILLFLGSIFFQLSAQTPQWNWVKGASSIGEESALDIAYDPLTGGVIAVGSWESDLSADLPSLTTPFGGRDGWVAKYSANGSVVWSFPLGGIGDDQVNAVCTDPAGNIYLTGFFSGTTQFRGVSPTPNFTLTSSGNEDAFLAKYDNNGTLIWVSHQSCPESVSGQAVAYGPNGVYVTGWYGDAALTLNSTTLPNIQDEDIYTAKYNALNGALVWARQAGGTSFDSASGIVADATHLYAIGQFKSPTFTFDGLGTLTNPTFNKNEIYVGKLDESNGNLVWSQRIGGTWEDDANGVALDPSGVLITGGIDDNGATVSFPGGITRTTGNNGEEIFVARLLKSSGLTDWVNVEINNSANDTRGMGVEFDGAGNLYVTGLMQGTTNFNGGANSVSATVWDVFVAKYQVSGGNLIWVKGAGGNGADQGFGIDTLSNGAGIYAGGVYEDVGTFDTVPGLPTNLGSNIWVGKMALSGHVAMADSFCIPFQTTTILDVLGNDPNPNSDSLITAIITGTTQGTITLLNADSIQYTPNPGFIGIDSLFYRVCDTAGDCDSAWVKLAVYPIADAGPDVLVCGNTFVMAGNNPAPGTGFWTNISGAGTLTSAINFNTPVSALGTTVNEFEWEISYLFCRSKDTVAVTQDTLAPFITCPPTQNVISNGVCQYTLPDFTGSVTVFDNCGPVGLTTTQNPAPATVLSAGTWPIDITATDQYGNSRTCTFTFEVAANINPTLISCGTSLTGETTFGALNDETNFSCSGVSTPGQDRFYQITVPNGNYWIQVTLDNVSDPNDARTELFWIGNNCPLGGSCLDHVRYNNNTQSFPNGSNTDKFLAVGPGTYFLAIDSRTDGITSYDIAFDCLESGIQFDTTGCVSDPDSNGFTASVNASSANLTVNPCQSAVTVCHELLIANPTDFEWIDSVHFDLGACYTNVAPATPIAGAFAAGSWTGTYNAGNNSIDWTFANSSSPGFGDGVGGTYNCYSYDFCFTADIAATCDSNPDLNVLITVADDGVGQNGNTARNLDAAISDSFVVVNPPPTILCPANVTVFSTLGNCTAVVNGLTPTATDNCPNPMVRYSLAGATIGMGTGDASGTTFNLGNTDLTYTVEDLAGDSATCTLIITLLDTFPPAIICPNDTTLTPNTACQFFIPNYSGLATGLQDNCTASGNIVVTQTPLPGTQITTQTQITLIATDASANSASCTFNVTPTGNTIPVNAGPDTTICGTTFSLMGNNNLPGNGQWTFIQGSGMLSNANDSTATVTGLAIGLNQLTWEITNGGCAGIDTVELTVISAPVAFAGNDTSICGKSIILTGSPLGTSTGIWTVVSGSGTFSTPGLPSPTVTNLASGLNEFQWKLTEGGCADSTTVQITAFDSVFADAGPLDTLCGPDGMLNGMPPAFGSGTWTRLNGMGTVTTPSLATSSVTGLAVGTNTFQWAVSNGVCVDSAAVSLFSIALPLADAGFPDSICGTTTQLNAILPPTGVGNWSVINGTGAFSNPALNNAQVSGLSIGQNTFQWTVTDGQCADSSTVDLFAFTIVNAIARTDTSLCTDQVLLTAQPLPTGSGTWTLLNGTGVISSPNQPTTLVTGLGQGQNTFLWQVNNGPCTAEDTVFINQESVTAEAGPDQSLCTTDTLTLAATPDPDGSWSLGVGFVDLENPLAADSRIYDPLPGPISLVWQVDNGVCSETDTVAFIAYSPPTASNAGVDQMVTPGTQITLAGNAPTIGTGQWSQLSGPAGLIFQQDSLPNTQVTGAEPGGSYLLSWTITNGVCPAFSDEMLLEVLPFTIPELVTVNGNGQNDTWEIIGLEQLGQVKATILNRWGTVIYETEDYQNDWNGINQAGEPVSDDTYYYVLELPDGKNFKGFVILKR